MMPDPSTGRGADATAQAALEAITANPVGLLDITAPDGSATWHVACNSDSVVVYNGYEYQPAGAELNDIEAALDGSVDQLPITIAAISSELAVYIANGGRINGARVVYRQVFRDHLDDPLHNVPCFAGVVDGGTMEGGQLSVTLYRAGGTARMQVPRGNYGPLCWKDFGSVGPGLCNYTGPEKLCNRSVARCIELGNVANFGGCPFGIKKVAS